MKPRRWRKLIAAGEDELMTTPTDLIDRARSGDQAAFERLISPHRDELRAHCYRMLGSLHDAEDAVQDSLVRAWRSVGTLDERGHIRAWLYKIATNRCLTALHQRSRRELPADLTDDRVSTEISWLEPYPGPTPETDYLSRESVELAFIATLQHLTASQRAVLILRVVLGYSAAEVAAQLETTTASVNSALQRARKAIHSAAPSQQSLLRELGERAVDDIVARWMMAWQNGDVDAIIALLAEDAQFSMPPLPQWFQGRGEIRTFLLTGPLLSSWRFLRTTSNGQVAFGTYLWDEAANAYIPGGLDILTIGEHGITAVTSFLDADFAAFDLPSSVTG
jgi:RNA polymerase sigma-70 factor (TIGR02960 family)